jgi:hypothetical protein
MGPDKVVNLVIPENLASAIGPLSAMGGAVFLLLADLLARMVQPVFGGELPRRQGAFYVVNQSPPWLVKLRVPLDKIARKSARSCRRT